MCQPLQAVLLIQGLATGLLGTTWHVSMEQEQAVIWQQTCLTQWQTPWPQLKTHAQMLPLGLATGLLGTT
jgi:hypothetical protein